MNEVIFNEPTPAKKSPSYEIGDLFCLTNQHGNKDIYILSQVSDSNNEVFFCLVGLESGNRWTRGEKNKEDAVKESSYRAYESDTAFEKIKKGSIITIKAQ
jgi:hypothetical protein